MMASPRFGSGTARTPESSSCTFVRGPLASALVPRPWLNRCAAAISASRTGGADGRAAGTEVGTRFRGPPRFWAVTRKPAWMATRATNTIVASRGPCSTSVACSPPADLNWSVQRISWHDTARRLNHSTVCFFNFPGFPRICDRHGRGRRSGFIISSDMSVKEERPDQGVAVAEAGPNTQVPPLFRVVLLNDEYTPMEFLSDALARFFSIPRPPPTP